MTEPEHPDTARSAASPASWPAARHCGRCAGKWSTAYETLADHYDWPAGVSAANYPDSQGYNRLPAAAVHAGTGRSGTATGWFGQWGDHPVPLGDTTHDVIVALVDADNSGTARWARRISG
jgi:hypothetical protein